MSGKRRAVFLGVAVLLLLLPMAQCAPPAEPQVIEKEVLIEPDYVTVRTNWIFNGIHAFVFYGKHLGFYKDEGIFLDIREGNGSGNVVRTIINKGDDFALVAAEPVFVQMSQGAPVKIIMTWEGVYSQGFICNPKSGVKTAKDLEGKLIVTSPGAANIAIHPIFIEKAGLDPSKMKDLILVDPGATVSAVLSGRADCEAAGWADQVPLYRAEGVEPSVVRLADYGMDGAVAGVIAHHDTLAQKPDLVKRFLRATRKAMDACAADKQACAQALLTDHPMLPADATLQQLELDMEMWKSDNMQCFGQVLAKDWDGVYALIKLMPDSGLEGDRPITDFLDDRFVPPCD